MWRSSCVSVVALAAAVMTPTNAARAQADAAEASERASDTQLSWVRLEGAESCPPAAAVMDDVSRRLGWNPFVRDDRAGHVRSVEVTVGYDGEVWEARMWTRVPGRRAAEPRVLTSEAVTCAALAQAVSLAVALLVDPDALSRPASKDLPPASLHEGAAAGGRAGALSVAGVLATGVLPRVAAGAELAGELALAPRLRLRLAAVFFPEVRAADDRFSFGLTAGAVELCARPWSTVRLRVGACAGVLAGALHVVTRQPRPEKPGQNPWLAASFGVRAQLMLSSALALTMDVIGETPLDRPRFYADGSDRTIFHQPAFGVVASAGLAVLFR